MAKLPVGPCTFVCGDVYTGYYYDLNFDVFVKLIARPYNILQAIHFRFLQLVV